MGLEDAKKRMRHHARRLGSLEMKAEELYHRSPAVRRFLAMQELEKRERKALERANDDVLYYYLKEDT